MNSDLKAFQIGNTTYFYKNKKIQFIYEFIGVCLCVVNFYILGLLFYAIVK